jgi:hypothetical protein
VLHWLQGLVQELGAAVFGAGGVGGLVAFLQSLGTNGLTSFAKTEVGQVLIAKLIAADCLTVIPEEDE